MRSILVAIDRKWILPVAMSATDLDSSDCCHVFGDADLQFHTKSLLKSVEDKGVPAQFTIPSSRRKLSQLLVSMTPVDLTLQQADGRPFSCSALRDLRPTLSTTSRNRVTVLATSIATCCSISAE